MIDLNFFKVLGAWGANVTLGFATKLCGFAAVGPFATITFADKFDSFSKSLLTLSQFGVAVVTIVYICFKIRNERRRKD